MKSQWTASFSFDSFAYPEALFEHRRGFGSDDLHSTIGARR